MSKQKGRVKAKIQPTLVDSLARSLELRQNSFVDLTQDDEAVDGEEMTILCPVCSIQMSLWQMDARIKHVEDCLSMLTIKNEERLEQSQSLGEDGRTIHTHTQRVTETKVEVKKRTKGKFTASETSGKRRKSKPVGIQVERNSFINTVPKVKPPPKIKADSDDVPQELLVSSRTNPIPELKILSFTMTENLDHGVAVDAFCYQPHNTILQYFLSHFHSDHYGGFTKRWCRERTLDKKIVYCSEITARLLRIRFNVEEQFIFPLKLNARCKVWDYGHALNVCNGDKTYDNNGSRSAFEEGYMLNGGFYSEEKTPGLYVTSIDANHCPGAVIFLFESISLSMESSFSLHCGDFRVCRDMLEHPIILPFHIGGSSVLDKAYLDTTYMSPEHNFPLQETVCDAAATLVEKFAEKGPLYNEYFGTTLQSRITDFLQLPRMKKKKFLILVGTYLIGKEKLAISILKRMDSCPIYVSNINSRGDKKEIITSFQNDFLDLVLTDDDVGKYSSAEVMIHLVPMKIVGSPKEISSYFNHNQYFNHFERCIGFRPTGWAFEGTSDFLELEDEKPYAEDASFQDMIEALKNRPNYTYLDILKQKRPQSDKLMDKPTFKIYSLPYSEHLSFRELSFFALVLNISEIIPTVNTGNEFSRAKMELIIEKWRILQGAITQKSTKNLSSELQNDLQSLTLESF